MKNSKLLPSEHIMQDRKARANGWRKKTVKNSAMPSNEYCMTPAAFENNYNFILSNRQRAILDAAKKELKNIKITVSDTPLFG